MNKLKKLIRKLIEESYIKDESVYEILGKKVSDFFDGPGTNRIDNEVIKYAKFFKGDGSFSAFYSAKEYLNSEGYESGSMQRNYPIAFIKKNKLKTDVRGNTIIDTKYENDRPFIISKFENLTNDNLKNIDGIILPITGENGDEKSMLVLFFVFPD